MHLLYKIRLQYGLKRQSRMPSMSDLREFIRGLSFTALLLVAYGAVAHIDDLAERVVVMEQVADIYAAEAKVLADCENNKATGYYRASSGRTFECSKPL